MSTSVMVEPIALADIFCSGIAKIEIIGPCARFFMYADQASLTDGTAERVIVAKFVLPIEAIPECIRQAIEATSSYAVGQITRTVQTALHLQ